MKFAAVVLLLALAAVADASPLRELMTYGKPVHKDEVVYCVKPEDYKGTRDQCPEHYECKELEHQFCKVVGQDCKWVKSSHCLVYNRYQGKCTSYKREYKCEEKKQCWDYSCVEKPLPCDPYAIYDECSAKYGKAPHGWSCMKLYKPQCTYKDVCTKHQGDCIEYGKDQKCEKKKECHKVLTDRCKEYNYEKKCEKYDDCKTVKGDCATYHYTNEKGGCKAYKYVDDCHYVKGNKCIEYKKREVCDKKCVKPKYTQKCHKVAQCQKWQGSYCTSYYKCEQVEDGCYSYEPVCHYVPSTECKTYNTVKSCKPKQAGCKEYHYINKKGACKTYHDKKVCVPKEKCETVKAGCKDYYYEDKCEDKLDCHYVPGKCIKYHERDVCKKVEDHCIKGVCEKKPEPPKKPVFKIVHRVHG